MKPGGSDSLVVGLQGPWPTATEAAWLARYQPAGVILFSRNVQDYSQLRSLCDALHQLVEGLEIMADHEGGPVSQLAVAVGRPPAAWALGVLDDPDLTTRVFAETGRRLAAVGVDRVLAPVADVLSEPRNPVIGARAFGGDSDLVCRHTAAAVSGLLEAGLHVCLKHWPGHGGSREDSHLRETDIGGGAASEPFVAGLHAGADGLMVGHLLTGDRRNGRLLPASLDPDFLAASRRVFSAGGAKGPIVFADDVTMGALGPPMERLGVPVPTVLPSGLFDPADLPRAWFESLTAAGCDRLLIRGLPLGAFPVGEEPGPPLSRPTSGPFPAEFSTGPYEEARARLWQESGAGFADMGEDLLWLDFSRGDRWEVAAGETGGGLDSVHRLMEPMFRSIRTEGVDPLGNRPFRRLLVASHRPLTDISPGIPDLDSGGVCLVLGHPSLKTDLEALLGPGWRVGALFDMAPEDMK